jgi:hypothetical protein
MVKALEQAIAEIGTLPDADQEEIGRRLLSHVEKLRQLREEIDKGTRSLDAGAGKPSTSLKRRTPLVQFMESLYVEGLDLSRGPDHGRDTEL